jgi:hypothetical protein
MCGTFGLRLHPEWNQSPSRHHKLALAIAGIDANYRDLIGRRDVVPRREIRARCATRSKERRISITCDQIVIASAHRVSAAIAPVDLQGGRHQSGAIILSSSCAAGLRFSRPRRRRSAPQRNYVRGFAHFDPCNRVTRYFADRTPRTISYSPLRSAAFPLG